MTEMFGGLRLGLVMAVGVILLLLAANFQGHPKLIAPVDPCLDPRARRLSSLGEVDQRSGIQ